MYSQLTRELRDAYNSIYLQENNIDEIRENIKYFMDSLLEEGFDIGEMNEDDLYNLYQFCIDETIDLNEGPLSFMKGIVKDPRVQQAALKYGQKYGGKLAGALKTGAKEVLKVPAQGVKNIGKALIKPLQTKVGSVAATLAGTEAILAGEKSKVRQAAGQVGPALTAAKKYVYGDDQKPAVAKPEPTPPPKPEKPKPQFTSKLYEDNVIEDAPLTVSGGRTGTGIGKKFKARPWTSAEVQKYKKARGAEQIKADIQFNKDVSAMNRQIAATPKGKDPEFYRPPAPGRTAPGRTAPDRTASPSVVKAAPAPPAPPVETRMSAVTGKKEYVGTTSGGQKFERRAATRAELEAAQKARQAALTSGKTRPEAEKAAVTSGIAASKTQKEEVMTREPYDLVLEYLFSQGHVDTLEEALYVMMEMPAETIQGICEAEVLAMKGGVPGSVKVKPALSIPGTDIGVGPNKPVPGTFTTTTPGQREKIAKGDTTIDRGTYQQSRVGAGPTSAERQRYNAELIRQGKHTAPRMPQ